VSTTLPAAVPTKPAFDGVLHSLTEFHTDMTVKSSSFGNTFCAFVRMSNYGYFPVG